MLALVLISFDDVCFSLLLFSYCQVADLFLSLRLLGNLAADFLAETLHQFAA